MRLPIDYSKIAESEKTALVSALLEIVEQQSITIQQQAELIQQLKDEIACLKGQKPKPNIRPSKLERDRKEKESSSGKRPGSHWDYLNDRLSKANNIPPVGNSSFSMETLLYSDEAQRIGPCGSDHSAGGSLYSSFKRVRPWNSELAVFLAKRVLSQEVFQ